jgi:predicted dehydrogenase
MNQINWGIIGCGDVTEKKSGPSFNKIKNSSLIAVMRRDKTLAEDYARRHQVPKWYDNADELIIDEEVNAIYIATPPAFHAEYTIKAANAGKAVYVEKPMALNYGECLKMIEMCKIKNVPLFVAYYRRTLPYFRKVKEILDSGLIGKIKFIDINLFKAPRPDDLNKKNLPWRVIPESSGYGGYFYDMASHQIDLLQFLLGNIKDYKGFSKNSAGLYLAKDTFIANFEFDSGAYGSGKWCFDMDNSFERDDVVITGIAGTIAFSTFDFTPVLLKTKNNTNTFEIENPENIQFPMIQSIVDELTGKGKSLADLQAAALTNLIMESIVKE